MTTEDECILSLGPLQELGHFTELLKLSSSADAGLISKTASLVCYVKQYIITDRAFLGFSLFLLFKPREQCNADKSWNHWHAFSQVRLSVIGSYVHKP